MFRKLGLLSLSVAMAFGAAGVASRANAADPVTIRYGLWDANQQPAYEACAAAFTKENPDITVKVEQLGWGDYWTGIQTGFASGDNYDVFTDHLAKFPEFAKNDQIVDIQPLVDRDKVKTDIYIGKLADLWSKDGKRYGLPKDWDTIAVVANGDMLKAAGIDPKVAETWTWNAKDGGTFGEAIAKLTIDENGNNGLSPKFDKTKVKQYGFINQGAGGFSGQTQWSMFAVSNGFEFTNGVWGNKYFYDNPALADTLQWYADLNLVKGYSPAFADIKSQGGGTLFQAGKGALTTDGSWTIGDYLGKSKFPVVFLRLPLGPKGRKSMFNGLADSISKTTKHLEESWKWVKFAASPTCEKIVGQTGVVFPAIQEAAELSLKVRADKNIDVSAFTKQALEDGGTFLFPITDHGADVSTIMDPVMESIMLGQAKAKDALADANTKVNALFK